MVVVVVLATTFDGDVVEFSLLDEPLLDGTVVATEPLLDGTVVATEPLLDGTVVVTEPLLDGTVVLVATYLIQLGLF